MLNPDSQPSSAKQDAMRRKLLKGQVKVSDTQANNIHDKEVSDILKGQLKGTSNSTQKLMSELPLKHGKKYHDVFNPKAKIDQSQIEVTPSINHSLVHDLLNLQHTGYEMAYPGHKIFPPQKSPNWLTSAMQKRLKGNK